MLVNLLIGLAAAVSVVYFVRMTRGAARQPIVKAAPIVLLALAVVVATEAGPLRGWLAFGLLWSAAGDVWLALDSRRYFVAGLACFLVAHLIYAGLFLQSSAVTTFGSIVIGVLLLFGLTVGTRLWPRLGRLRLPVVAYLLVIMLMGIAAALHAPFSVWLAGGALLFALSDGAIAVDKFLQPLPARDWLVMLSYYLAQGLIVVGWLLSQMAL